MNSADFDFGIEETPEVPRNKIKTSGIIKYTQDRPEYYSLPEDGKMDFAIYMLNYAVEKNKDFAQGYSEMQGVNFTSGKWWLSLLVPEPKLFVNRTVSLMYFLVVLLIIFMLILFIIFKFLRLGGNIINRTPIHEVKDGTLLMTTLYLVFFAVSVFLVEKVYTMTTDKIEEVQYAIH